MIRPASTSGLEASALAVALFLVLAGCGTTKPPVPEPAKTPFVAPETKRPADRPPAKEESPALPPPKLIVPLGPPEPGVSPEQGAAIPISFTDLELGFQPGEAFDRARLTPRAKQLLGKQVAIRGYVYSELTTTTLFRFPFLRSPECPFGPGANAEHVIDVQMEGDKTTEYTTHPVTVVGTLSVEPYLGDDGTPWAYFRIVARRVQR